MDFHEEIYAPPPGPPEPPRINCLECEGVFTTSDALHEHVFTSHPIASPVLLHRGVVCGSATLLVQRATKPADWSVVNCDWTRVDEVVVPPERLGEHLSRESGFVKVEIGNMRTNTTYKFDFAIAAEQDLIGVDNVLEQLLDKVEKVAEFEITPKSISSDFLDRTAPFDTARKYAEGIAEYLYWLAHRRAGGASDVALDREKLNRSAELLRHMHRPVALAVTSLISLYHNHFEEAADRALSRGLHAVAARLARMLTAGAQPVDPGRIVHDLADLERRLIDKRTQALIDLCRLPIDASATDDVAGFDHIYVATESYDRTKAHLFIAEYHLATGTPYTERLIRAAGQNGVPEHWVESRLNLIGDEG
ncbi:hypothetical protein IRT45_15975 [Nocardia sp. BSTN01]|uniref:hypothetical protein n=1 Tax=Nocardia sp. BSTN01 TaxID=2783665 RepID=UPI00188F0522|nr:hypothetical protein [Nocardia sp. BSTN01]MBF4998649.1 hypothetical protein [Nocardia sp. BSTN01]